MTSKQCEQNQKTDAVGRLTKDEGEVLVSGKNHVQGVDKRLLIQIMTSKPTRKEVKYLFHDKCQNMCTS